MFMLLTTVTEVPNKINVHFYNRQMLFTQNYSIGRLLVYNNIPQSSMLCWWQENSNKKLALRNREVKIVVFDFTVDLQKLLSGAMFWNYVMKVVYRW